MIRLQWVVSLVTFTLFSPLFMSSLHADTVVIPLTWIPNYPTLNSDKAEEVNLNKIYNTTFDTLLGLDDFMYPTPKVFSKWKIDNSSQAVVFSISENAKFSDGSKVLSRDILNIFLKAKNKNSKMVSQIKGIDKCSSKRCRGIEIINKKTLKIHLTDENYLIFLKKLSGIDATVLKSKLLGTTRLKVSKIKRNEVLVENSIDKNFLFKSIKPNQAEELFFENKIDLLTEVDFPITKRKILNRYPHTTKIAGTYYLAFNSRKKSVFKSKKLRQLIVKSFNSKEFVNFTEVNGIAANGMIPKGYLGYNSLMRMNKEVNKVSSLWKKEKSITLGMREKFKANPKIENYLKKFFMGHGLRLKVKYLPFLDVLKGMKSGLFDIILKGDAPLNYESVNAFISFVDVNMRGLTGFNGPKLNALYKSYENSITRGKKKEILQKMEKVFFQEAPALPLFYPTFKTWYQKKHKNKIKNKVSVKFWDFSYRHL